MAAQLVWFKRDLRVEDHEPLYQAAQRGPVICLYIDEPIVENLLALDSACLHLP